MGYRADSYDPYGDLLTDEEQDAGSYFGRHWRGHLPLAQSYWLNGFLTNIALGGLGVALLTLEKTGRSLRMIAIGFLVYVLLFLMARVWASVGIWRSAGRHGARGGAPAWGVVARILVGVGILATLAQLPNMGLQAKEYGLIAIGRDPLGPPPLMSVAQDGKTLQLKGTLSAGVADQFDALVEASPRARLVLLDSDGGRIFEALRMAEVIKAHGLDTRVEQHCASACTFLLLAGKDRSAHRFAEIGFHQPDFPGLSKAQRLETIEDNRQDYIKAGINPAFLERALSTPPNEIWYPTHAELVDAGVLVGEEFTVGSSKDDLRRLNELLVRMEGELNLARGTMIDDMTQLDGAKLRRNELRSRHILTRPFSRQEGIQLRNNLRVALTDELCDSPKRRMIEMGAAFGFDYFSAGGAEIASVTINKCPAPPDA